MAAELPTANDAAPADWQSDFGFEDSVSQVSEAQPQTQPQRLSASRKRPRPSAGPSSSASSASASMPPRSGSAAVSDGACREEALARRQQLLAMDAYSRHKMLVNSYIKYYGGSYADFGRDASGDKRDIDVIREHHRFVWEDGAATSWEQRLAKRYWEKLYKEYCIADLRGYREGRVGLRWRTEAEVLSGRGQFACGAKRCQEADSLASWEVNFRYVEAGETKNALVKLRLCPDCSARLNYKKRHRKREAKRRRLEAEAAEPQQGEQQEQEGGNDAILQGIRAIRADQQQQEQQVEAAAAAADAGDGDANDIWRQPAPAVEDEGASKDEEFDQYFSDMLL